MVPRYGTIRSDRRLVRAACALTHVPFKPRDHAPDRDEDVGPQEREPERHDAEQRPAFKGLHTRRNKEVLREKERYEAEYQKYEVLLVLTYRKRRENKTCVNGGECNIVLDQRDERDHNDNGKRVRYNGGEEDYPGKNAGHQGTVYPAMLAPSRSEEH